MADRLTMRDVQLRRMGRSLAYVFGQLERLGVKCAEKNADVPRRRLTTLERRAIRKQIRRDLKASLQLIESGDRHK